MRARERHLDPDGFAAQKALYRQLHDIEGVPEQRDDADARNVFDRLKDAIGGE